VRISLEGELPTAVISMHSNEAAVFHMRIYRVDSELSEGVLYSIAKNVFFQSVPELIKHYMWATVTDGEKHVQDDGRRLPCGTGLHRRLMPRTGAAGPWRARARRSNISLACSPNVSGIPAG